eukprot:4889119-Pyramimonas_sp.AAC.2
MVRTKVGASVADFRKICNDISALADKTIVQMHKHVVSTVFARSARATPRASACLDCPTAVPG